MKLIFLRTWVLSFRDAELTYQSLQSYNKKIHSDQAFLQMSPKDAEAGSQLCFAY